MKKNYLTLLLLCTISVLNLNSQELIANMRSGALDGINGDTADMIEFNGKLLFTAHLGDGKAYELVEYDPITGIVTNLTDIDPGSDDSFPNYKVVLNNTLFFVADAEETGSGPISFTELYSYNSDGTLTKIPSNGFSNNTNNANTDINPKNLTLYNGNIYFSAQKSDVKVEVQLLKMPSNGNYSEVVISGAYVRGGFENHPEPASFEVTNNKLFFSANVSNSERGLFFYDDTNNTSGRIGTHSYPPYVKANGTDLFYLAQGTYWKYDTTSGTSSPNIFATNAPIPKTKPVTHSGKMYYRSEFTSPFSSNDLVIYDIATDTHTRVRINSTVDSNVSHFEKYGGKIFFAAEDDNAGKELHMYDPISEKYTLVSNIRLGSSGSFPSSYYIFQNRMYFAATSQSEGRELWVMEGTNIAPKIKAFIGNQTYVQDANGIATFNLLDYFKEDFEDGANISFSSSSGSPNLVTTSVQGNTLTINYTLNVGVSAINVTSTDSGGKSISQEFDVIIESATASIDDVISKSFNLYPNPTKTSFKLESNNYNIKKVAIFNILGAKVTSFSNALESYNVSNLTRGIYQVVVATERGKGIKKLVIE
ncbi:T9SS type A sorting domain-containing protein [Polaribacter porphyrae]|uniref:Secretion system C-terminal sorting domain-containing protein n=1 Tax=Polaribacter porphyrae TaxID=1137780 RepID=A0A2S7WRY9_9FLAO|nr:T9SS type A sorting domain-containing protein [Polaribacter porphyrae]PQJ80365.1 hypothetical protein BTO18_14800 [Polaribacter porphyrae]